jgi:hypothetical protein
MEIVISSADKNVYAWHHDGSTVAGIVITNYQQGIVLAGATDVKIYGTSMSLISQGGIVVQGSLDVVECCLKMEPRNFHVLYCIADLLLALA